MVSKGWISAALVFLFFASMASAQEVQTTERAIPGQYIVVLNDDQTARANVRPAVDGLARQHGARVTHVFENTIRGFAASMSATAAAAMARNPRVRYIEQDSQRFIVETQSGATWGLDRIDQRDRPVNGTYTYETVAANVDVYVIDTGIRATHTEFGGRVSTLGFTAINDGNGTNDCNGHGTHVSGTIGGATYGVAKSVTLHAVRVLDCSGSGSTSGVIAGVDWVTANRTLPAVANMSLGGGASTALDQAVSNSIADGVTYALAAGNSNANACNSSPARTPNAITVGATTSSDARASYSNYGTCLDVFAPGSNITSAWSTSNTATNTISGTSMASPHVAGAAAVYLDANPGATPAQVASALSAAATTGKVTSPGSGSPNRLLYSAPPGGGGTNPPPTDTCGPGTITDTGSLTGTGSVAYAPSGGSYTTTVSGVHRGCFSGTGRDFDLYLQKLSGATWSTVARSEGSASTEQISYSGTAGTYRWRIYSYNGAGTFTLNWSRP